MSSIEGKLKQEFGQRLETLLRQNEYLVQKQDDVVGQIKLYEDKIIKLNQENARLTNSLQSAGQIDFVNKNLVENNKSLQDQIKQIQDECYSLKMKNNQSVQDPNTNALKEAYIILQNRINGYSQLLEDKDKEISAKDSNLLEKNQEIEELNKQLENSRKELVNFFVFLM